MSWYNPFSWFGSGTDKAIVDQAGHDVLLLAQARADAAAGIVSAADYQALRETFLRVHGAGALAAFDASAPVVPAGATVAEIQSSIEIGELDFSGLEAAIGAAEASAKDKVDAVYDKSVVDAAKGLPGSIADMVGAFWAGLPAWMKWAGIAAVALFGLHTLARLGVRVPRPARRRKAA